MVEKILNSAICKVYIFSFVYRKKHATQSPLARPITDDDDDYNDDEQ